MTDDLPPFARYIALVMFLQTPEPVTPRAPAQARTPRRTWSDEDRAHYFRVRERGVSIRKAAVRLGIPIGTAKCWDQERQGNR